MSLLPIQQRNRVRTQRSEQRAAVNQWRAAAVAKRDKRPARRRSDPARQPPGPPWQWRALIAVIYLASAITSLTVMQWLWRLIKPFFRHDT